VNPFGGSTGSQVTGPDRKWRQSRDRKWRKRKWRHNWTYVLHMRNRYILYYYYSSSIQCSTVVQVLWLPEMTEGHVTPLGVPLCVRMCNRKLRNIRPSGAFWPEITSDRSSRNPCGVPLGVRMRNRKLRNIRPNMTFSLEVTSSNVTGRASPGTRSLGCSLWRPCLSLSSLGYVPLLFSYNISVMVFTYGVFGYVL
jgi:hypothetical protein